MTRQKFGFQESQMSGAEIAIPIITALGPTVLLIISEALGITATHNTSTCGSVVQLGLSGYQYAKKKIREAVQAQPLRSGHEVEEIELETMSGQTSATKPSRNDPTAFGL